MTRVNKPSFQIAITILFFALAGCSTNDGTAENIEVVETFMAMLDAQRFGDLESVLCPNLQVHLSGIDLTRDQFIQRARGVYERFPDFRHEIDDILGVENKVVLRATDYATQAETGRSITVGQISIYRIDDGCIAEWWEEFDRFGFNSQLATPDSVDNPE